MSYDARPQACRAFPLYTAICAISGARVPYLAAYLQCEQGVKVLKQIENTVLSLDMGAALEV